MKIDVKNIEGKTVKQIELPDAIFAVELNEHVLHLVNKGYQANKRQGTHWAKTRAYVSGGGKKPFKQKGTGNARQGSSRSPLNPGGAVLHGPQPRDYRQKMNKKLRTLAMQVALSDKVRNKALIVVDDFKLSKFSTKAVVGALAKLNAKGALVADERKDEFLYKSARNINGTACVEPAVMNAEHVLRHKAVVITETALNVLNKRLSV